MLSKRKAGELLIGWTRPLQVTFAPPSSQVSPKPESIRSYYWQGKHLSTGSQHSQRTIRRFKKDSSILESAITSTLSNLNTSDQSTKGSKTPPSWVCYRVTTFGGWWSWMPRWNSKHTAPASCLWNLGTSGIVLAHSWKRRWDQHKDPLLARKGFALGTRGNTGNSASRFGGQQLQDSPDDPPATPRSFPPACSQTDLFPTALSTPRSPPQG